MTWSAAATGAAGPYVYQFYEYADGKWEVVQPYSPASTWCWDTSGASVGTHYFTVYARSAASTALYDVAQFASYTIAAQPASSLTLAASPSGPQPAGAVVDFAAAAAGGFGQYEYQFYQYIDGRWVVVQPYGLGSAWHWDTTGIDQGTYYFTVYARSLGSTALYDVAQFVSYTITPLPASSVTIESSPAGPQPAGAAVVFKARASGGSGRYEYQFYQYINGQCVVVRPYGPDATWSWDTSGAAPGPHYFTVYARSVGSTAPYNVALFASYTITPPPASMVSLESSPTGPRPAGTTVVFTASASGGSGQYEYQFYQYVNGQWVVVQPYSSASTWRWDSSGASAGTQYFTVFARNAGSNAINDVAQFASYTIAPKPATAVALTPSPAGPQPEGTEVMFTAVADGGSGQYEYQFYQFVGGQWIVVQPYSSASTWRWDSTGVAAGPQYFTVYARSAGSAALADVSQFTGYTIIAQPASEVTLTPSLASPQMPGAEVVFTAAASGGSGTYEYQFYQQVDGLWEVVRPYAPEPTWCWDTTGTGPGTHYFTVYARSVGSLSPYDTSAFLAYSVVSKPSWNKVLAHAPWSPRDSAGKFVFQDKMWLVGGYTPGLVSDVWNSSNGVDWEKTAESACPGEINVPVQATLNNRMLIISNTGALCTSVDGSGWNVEADSLPFGSRYASGSAIFNGKLWVLGGLVIGGQLTNDVWSSADGVNWTQVLANAPWAPRSLYGNVLVYDDKLWIFGGGSAVAYHPFIGYQDVWNTSDGITWNKVTDSAPWPSRLWSSAVVYKNRMWLFGGYQSEPVSQNFNDVWYSRDGVVWDKYEADVSWSERHEIAPYVYQGKLWVMSGNGNTLNNDVWNLDIPGLIFVSDPVTDATLGQLYQYAARADFNENRDAITYKIVAAPDWLSIDTNTGLLSGTPQSQGRFTVILEANDPSGETAKQSFTLRICATDG